MDHFELVSEYAPTGDHRPACKRLSRRKPMPDFTGSYRLWQDVHNGKRHTTIK